MDGQGRLFNGVAPVELITGEGGGAIRILLHIISGAFVELQVYRPDGEETFDLPPLDSFTASSI